MLSKIHHHTHRRDFKAELDAAKIVGIVAAFLIAGLAINFMSATTSTMTGAVNTTVSEASYIIFKDDAGMTCAKNGETGKIDFRSSNSSSVIQSANDETRNYGMIFIKRSTATPVYWSYNLQNFTLDYNLTYPISVSPGVSIVGEGTNFDVRSLDGVAFNGNYLGDHWTIDSKHWRFEHLGFFGLRSLNTTAIQVSEYNWGVVIDDIKTQFVNNSIKLIGGCYDSIVSNCKLNQGARGIELAYADGGYANSFKTIGNDIEAMTVFGMSLNGAGVSASSNYLEGNKICIISNYCTITNNFIQPEEIGIQLLQATNIVTNNRFNVNPGTIGISQSGSYKSGTIDCNNFYVHATGQAINSSQDNMLTITGNTVNGDGYFIKGVLYSSTVSNNIIGGGLTSINVTSHNSVFSSNIFYNSKFALSIGGVSNTITSNNFVLGVTNILQYAGTQNVITDNLLSGTYKINITGGSTPTYRDNSGMITKNRGVGLIEIGNSSVTITYGIPDIPHSIQVTGMNNYSSSLYVAALNSVTFTVYVPVPVTTLTYFWWTAEV